MKVTVIIPCFNAIDKIERCLVSLRAIDMNHLDYEVIFIDDCSTDGTFELIVRECKNESNWRTERLPVNSGSPSRPRNRGLTLAKGEYVFFLDCDDEILSDTLRLHYEFALVENADMVRGYLLVDDGRERVIANRLVDWNDTLTPKERVEIIIKNQSLTKTCFFRSSLLKKKNITYPEHMKMGEDTVFVADAMRASTSICYIDHPTYVYNKIFDFSLSITQSFGAKELRDHLFMWPHLQNTFSHLRINYYDVRFKVSLRYILTLLIRRNRGDIDEILFQEFSRFILNIIDVVNQFDYPSRYKEIIESLRCGNYNDFRLLCRPRLLIAGSDLKFIASALKALEVYFDVRFDEWLGHAEHNEEKSRELLEWAELIWCEWLLGNAVWYSLNKKAHHKLIIRMHRFEVGCKFGDQIDIQNVDAVVSVCVHFFERMLERFHNIPRAKARLLPIGYETNEYTNHYHDDRLYTLGMIGILPSRKGLDQALRILARLRKIDSRYRLEIFGKKPEELSWIATDKLEMKFFKECENIITENNLKNSVTFHGHSDVKQALSDMKVGFVLSTSQSMRDLPGFEAFHVAVGDGYLGGAVSLILDYIGCEFVWPSEFILASVDDVVDRILTYQNNPKKFLEDSGRGRHFVESQYNVNHFAKSIKELFLESPSC
jgi:glycosyltransferase involved in cell wall biosynthesis